MCPVLLYGEYCLTLRCTRLLHDAYHLVAVVLCAYVAVKDFFSNEYVLVSSEVSCCVQHKLLCHQARLPFGRTTKAALSWR